MWLEVHARAYELGGGRPSSVQVLGRTAHRHCGHLRRDGRAAVVEAAVLLPVHHLVDVRVREGAIQALSPEAGQPRGAAGARRRQGRRGARVRERGGGPRGGLCSRGPATVCGWTPACGGCGPGVRQGEARHSTRSRPRRCLRVMQQSRALRVRAVAREVEATLARQEFASRSELPVSTLIRGFISRRHPVEHGRRQPVGVAPHRPAWVAANVQPPRLGRAYVPAGAGHGPRAGPASPPPTPAA
mmetsp:Transcript_19598/g.55086  ORF Transcript_19598/g.55086 Transcript_19598/m.55086 type:complete len:244 (-) Transcript_19598:7-738(-)